ncbi:unnamed protein product [Closterium sp. NIES-54]
MRARKSAVVGATRQDTLVETDSVTENRAINGAREPALATATSRSRPRLEQQEPEIDEPRVTAQEESERVKFVNGEAVAHLENSQNGRANGKKGTESGTGGGKEAARFTDRSGIHGRGGATGCAGNSKALICMALLALQYGLQPILTRKLLSRDVLISSQVITCEVLKVLIALTAMFLDGSLFTFWRNWHPLDSLEAAAVPGLLYAAQNTLIQVALRHLDYLTFNLLNQTKLLFTALSNYLFLGIRQTRVQIVALCMLLVAATLLTLSPGPSSSPGSGSGSGSGQDLSLGSSAAEGGALGGDGAGQGLSTAAGAAAASAAAAAATAAAVLAAGVAWERVALGVVPVLVASVTSGLGSTHNQWQVQVKRRSPHLFTIEMCSLTSLVLLVSLFTSQDGARMLQLGFFHAWTPLTFIPALSNAIGGILVGLVTKYAGGVKKGFTVIAGLLVTATVQYALDGTPPSLYVWMALPLTVLSTYLYSSSAAPPAVPAAKSKEL